VAITLPLDVVESLRSASFIDVFDLWQWIETKYDVQGKAALGRVDRYYLLVRLLHRKDAIHHWLYARCREVEADPDDHLDLWFREGYKSTIITFAGAIQELLVNPELTIGIFSHVRPIAAAFLDQIKTEFELNEELKATYSEILWANPKRDAPRAGAKWNSERIDVIRTSNPKEGSVQAWGLVDGQPTSKHYGLRIYDDVVTRESVTTPEQVQKTTAAWELSDNLGARQESGMGGRRWHVGTRYSFADTYGVILERKVLTPRIYPATDDGSPNGKPVFHTPEAWAEKRLSQSDAVLACQMLQNPAAGQMAMFKKERLRFIDIRPGTLNVYILVDPASSKKKGSDRTAIAVIGVDYNRNKYLIDGYAHKMNLQERWIAFSQLRKHWQVQPGIQSVTVGYERYGMQSDLDYFTEKMEQSRDSFTITELNWPNEGPGAKIDRIQRLVPDFGHGKFFLAASIDMQLEDGTWVAAETKNQKRMRATGEAYRILTPTKRRDHEGNLYSLNTIFLNEYVVYPFASHDDLLDACSRIYDIDYTPPIIIKESDLEPEEYED
jgi:hypothetical protein